MDLFWADHCIKNKTGSQIFEKLYGLNLGLIIWSEFEESINPKQPIFSA